MDRLNNIQTKYPRIDIEEVISNMDIPEADKEKRVELAEKVRDVFDWLFAFVITASVTEGTLDIEYLTLSVEYRLKDLVNLDIQYVREQVEKFSRDIVETTVENKDEDYFLSPQRADERAIDEANAIYGYEELDEAIKEGKTHKTWVSEKLKSTRKWHRDMDGVTIPIEDYFHFDDCDMLLPHDMNGTARQNSGCLCHVEFS